MALSFFALYAILFFCFQTYNDIYMKKTKIVATIGPATESKEKLEELLKDGMNVMRINFSHGDFAEHARKVINLRSVMRKTGLRAAILQDLSGPKIRIGDFKTDSIELIPGKTFILTTDIIKGDEKRVSIHYKNLQKEVKKGHIIYLYDGKRKLKVVKVRGNDVLCRVIVGGNIRGRRGVNLPDSELSIGSLTKKDIRDLEFGLKYDVDFIALSFVRRPEDIDELRAILKKRKSSALIIAKIETPQAIRNLDEIINKADGIMVARGDLAIEVPAEQVPLIQKMIIEKCNNLGKPVITATQMLESMIKNPIPTRAEVSDVANAILDGTDAIMLSEETALGDYPVEAVKMMSKIAQEIERNYPERVIVHSRDNGTSDITDSITGSVVKAAHDVGAKAIVALTESGFTARMIARYKPEPVILALSPSEKTCKQIHLSFGCLPAHIKRYKTVNEAVALVRQRCLTEKIALKGDRVVIACGVPSAKKGVATNMILVETI